MLYEMSLSNQQNIISLYLNLFVIFAKFYFSWTNYNKTGLFQRSLNFVICFSSD